MESTRTETSTQISQKGDTVTVKTITKVTTEKPGQEPKVEITEKVDEYKGEEGQKKLPKEIKEQIEKNKTKVVKPTNKNATEGNFAKDCLKEVNKLRASHGSGPLKLDDELMAFSEKTAKEFAKTDKSNISIVTAYGVIINTLWSDDPGNTVKAKYIVDRWYEESEKHDFKSEPTGCQTGHFTQMIWKDSKKFGVAGAKSDTNKIYIVATFDPAGNVKDEYLQNVLPKGTPVEAKNRRKSSSSSASSSAEENDDELNKQGVAIHNEYRSKHGVPPLKHSTELQKYAQEWADHLAKVDKFEHRKEHKYGENLYFLMDPKKQATAKDACAEWYSEIQYFSFGEEPKTTKAGHFTQMIWKESEKVGLGRATSKSGKQIIVANYNPGGNMLGKFATCVPKVIS